MTTQTRKPDRPASSPTALDRSTVFRGAIFDVDDVGVRLHDGRVTYRQVVTKADGAIAVPVTDRGTLVMVRQHRAGLLDDPAYPDCEVYEFPAGHVDPGEAPAAAAERELLEETGYTATRVMSHYANTLASPRFLPGRNITDGVGVAGQSGACRHLCPGRWPG